MRVSKAYRTTPRVSYGRAMMSLLSTPSRAAFRIAIVSDYDALFICHVDATRGQNFASRCLRVHYTKM
jgi:hypothetical protein